jgi:hypothetical protein
MKLFNVRGGTMHTNSQIIGPNLYGPVNPEKFVHAIFETYRHLDGSNDRTVFMMKLNYTFENDDYEVPDKLAASLISFRIFWRFMTLSDAIGYYPDRFSSLTQLTGKKLAAYKNSLLMATAVCPFSSHEEERPTFDMDKLLALAAKFHESESWRFGEPENKVGQKSSN